MKNIGILGSGTVATTLADGFLRQGHAVMLGTEHPDKLKPWLAKAGPTGQMGNFAAAAAFGDVLVLAVKGGAAVQVLQRLDKSMLAGKTVLDATNPIADAPPKNGVLRFSTSFDESLLEACQRAVPEAHFVKAFNSVGAPVMVNPDFGGITPTMFICGNNEQAKAEATELIEAFGYEAEDMGTAEAARAIEPLCILWCIPGFRSNDWQHAFKLLKKSPVPETA